MTSIFRRRLGDLCIRNPAIAALFFLVAFSPRLTANEAATESSQIEECRAGWATFFNALKSLRVEYTWRIDALGDPAALKQYLGVTGTGSTEAKHVFAFKGDQRYFSYDNNEYLASGKIKKAGEHYEYAYNERTRQMYSHLANRMGLDSARGGKSDNDGGEYQQFYLRALFHVLPDVFSSNARSTLRLPDALADEDVHVRPAPEEIDGHACVVVELRKSNRILWADPRVDYALRQWEVRTPDTNRLIWRYHLRDYKPVAPGVQLPFLIVQEEGAPKAPEEFQKAPLLSWTFRVTQAEANNVPDSTFTLGLKAGMTVTDRTAAFFPVMYTVPADGKQLDATIASAVARASAVMGGRSASPWRIWIVLAAANLLLLGALAAIVLVRRRRRKILVLLLALSAWSTTACGAENEAKTPTKSTATESSQIEECRAGWATFYNALKSLRVDYNYRSEAFVDLAVLKQYLGIIELIDENHTFAFKGDQRYYSYDRKVSDASGKVGARRQGEHYEYAYNGHKRQMRSHDTNWLGLDSAQNGVSTTDAHYFNQAYLKALIRVLPDVFNSDSRMMQRLPDILADEDVHVRPATEAIDGSPCVVIELRKSNRILWADPRLNYALRQWELRTPDSNLLRGRYHLRDYKPVAPGLELPFLIVEEWGAPQAPSNLQNVPLLGYELRLTHVDVNNVPESTFTLDLKPGLTVTDRTVGPGPVMYTVPADGKKLDSTIASAVARVNALLGSQGQSPSPWRIWIILASANLLLLGALAAIVLVRRRRRKILVLLLALSAWSTTACGARLQARFHPLAQSRGQDDHQRPRPPSQHFHERLARQLPGHALTPDLVDDLERTLESPLEELLVRPAP